jgi:hypothetical protein
MYENLESPATAKFAKKNSAKTGNSSWTWKESNASEKLLSLVFGNRHNVRGEPVFNVMAAGWFCEKSGRNGKVEDVKPVLFYFI